MSVLDTFYILFDSDASKLDKGLKETEQKADKLGKGLKDVDGLAGKLGGSMANTLATFAGAAVAAIGLHAMADAMFQAVEHADKLNEAAERLGINIETISAWGDAIKKNGGSTESFIGSIENLNSALSQIEVTGKSRAAPFLKELGIDLDDAANQGKNAMDFLPQIADAFASMDKQKSVALGKRLGFDQATIMTLQAGRREVEEMIAKEKELGVVTKKQAEIADAFGDQMDDMKHAFRSVWLSVSETILPALTWVLKKFQDLAVFMREHSDLIVGFMVAIGAAILTYVIPPLTAMAVEALIAFAPFILAGAIVAALAAAFALLYEDVMTFLDGGDSMIGALIDKFGQLKEWVLGVWKSITDGWDALIDNISDKMLAAANVIKAIWKAIMDMILGHINMVKSGINSVASFFGFGGSNDVKKGQAAIAQSASSPLASQSSAAIANSRSTKNTTVSVGKVEVKTQATDADGISKAIGGSMQTQMRQAVNNYDDGVLG